MLNSSPHSYDASAQAESKCDENLLLTEPSLITYNGTQIESRPGKGSLQLLIKRCLDLIISALALILLSPLLLVIALLILITSPGPIFFIQERIGYLGKKFRVFKFRTMIPNADSMKEDLMDLNEMDGPVFKIKDDPRITPFGRFLRKTSLDELPQLMNVLLGEMSLVGPRPLETREALQLKGWQLKRLEMKPGLTCLWAINGRNLLTFEEWMLYDRQYIDNWSLWLDLKIILKTIPEIIAGHGM